MACWADRMTVFSSLLASARRFFARPEPVAPAPPAPLDPSIVPVVDALRLEIDGLRREINSVKGDLYGLSISYSRDHFTLYEKMRSQKIEALRRTGVTADLALLTRRCVEIRRNIADLQRALTAAGIDLTSELLEDPEDG
jgi:hypothetical protein